MLPFDVLLGVIRSSLSDTVLPSCVPIGAGLYLPHPTGIIINHQARIGSNVALFQQVTIGEWHGKAPEIGDECALFAGAKVFGGISIGRNCKLGANVVVSECVPNNSSVSAAEPVIRPRTSN